MANQIQNRKKSNPNYYWIPCFNILAYVGVVAIKVTFSNGYLNVVQSAFVNLFNNQHSAGKARFSFLRSMESESIDKESRISSFLEIAVGASGVTAIECLQVFFYSLMVCLVYKKNIRRREERKRG